MGNIQHEGVEEVRSGNGPRWSLGGLAGSWSWVVDGRVYHGAVGCEVAFVFTADARGLILADVISRRHTCSLPPSIPLVQWGTK